MLYVIYVLKHAERAEFSTIGIFVNLLMPRHNWAKCRPTSTQSRSMRVLDVELMDFMRDAYEGMFIYSTHVPHMNDPLELPRANTI